MISHIRVHASWAECCIFVAFGDRPICLSDNFLESHFLLTATALHLIILIMRDNTIPMQPCNSLSHEFCL